MKYSLTFWQRLTLPITWILWAGCDPTERKSWHHVKKGMEPHKHNFVLPADYDFLLQCDHEGCTMCEDMQYMNETAK